MRAYSIRRLSTLRLSALEVDSHPLIRNHLSASARHRLNLPRKHSRRRNQYQAFPTRLRSSVQASINSYLALADEHATIGKFVSSVQFVRDITGYTFIDRHLLLQALYGGSNSEHPHQRLALLGDILLEYILVDDWFQSGLPTSNVGSAISLVVTNANLATIAKRTGLVRHIQSLDPGTSKQTSDHKLGTIVEALLGAIHEDSGKNNEAVRGAMHQMGLTLPDLYTTRPNPKPSTIRKTNSKLDPKRPKKQEPLATERARELHNATNQDSHENEDVDQEGLGYRHEIAGDEATSDVDLESMDAARAMLDDLGTGQESYEDHDADQAILEDNDFEQSHLEDQDAGQMSLWIPATYQEDIKDTTAELGSSSWKALSPAKKFDNAIGALTRADDDDFPLDFGNLARRMTGKPLCKSVEPETPVRRVAGHVRHDWAPQHCQVTLDVALSDKPIRLRD